jgi:hypothetical protein
MNQKVPLYTRKLLRKDRLRKEAERAEEAKALESLRHTPPQWRDHTLAMRKMLGGVTW